MTRARGRRTVRELENVPTREMTSAEYERSDDGKPYTVTFGNAGARFHVTGIHSARAVAGAHGAITEGHTR